MDLFAAVGAVIIFIPQYGAWIASMGFDDSWGKSCSRVKVSALLCGSIEKSCVEGLSVHVSHLYGSVGSKVVSNMLVSVQEVDNRLRGMRASYYLDLVASVEKEVSPTGRQRVYPVLYR